MLHSNGDGDPAVRGYWSGHKVIDPSELESRFSVEDGLGFLDISTSEQVTEEGVEQMERVRKILPLLPPREADFIELYYFYKKKQTDIALMFQVSQPTVCYRLQRAAYRIRFLLSLPDINDGELEQAFTGFLPDPLDIRIMVLMYETTCQSEVAKRLRVTQGFVRHRFIRSIGRMGWENVKHDPDPEKSEWVQVREVPNMDKYASLFVSIAKNLNVLREVQRPTWGPKVYRAIE